MAGAQPVLLQQLVVPTGLGEDVLESQALDGHRVVLTATTVADSAPLSNLSAGPVLLASC